MFANNYAFRGDLAAWDVSRVRSLERAFFAAEAFDGDLSGWNVSRVTNMRGAFQRASAFDADLSSWEVARVTTMQNMFTKALAFKGKNISSWDVGQVTTMRHMFVLAGEFEGNLSSWNVEKVTDSESQSPFFVCCVSCPLVLSHPLFSRWSHVQWKKCSDSALPFAGTCRGGTSAR